MQCSVLSLCVVLCLSIVFCVDYRCCLIMATLWNRPGHYIFVLWFLLLSSFSSSFFFFSPNLNQRLRSVREFWAPQQISTGLASSLHYCSDVAQWRPTKLCMMFGHLLGWYTIYTFIFGGMTEIYRTFTHHESVFCEESDGACRKHKVRPLVRVGVCKDIQPV